MGKFRPLQRFVIRLFGFGALLLGTGFGELLAQEPQAQGKPPAQPVAQPGAKAGKAPVTSEPSAPIHQKGAVRLTPGEKWAVHSGDRPQPAVVSSAQAVILPPPSDAEVLFDGTDLSKWLASKGRPASWSVSNGVLSAVPGAGPLQTAARFADCQIHLEWSVPVEVRGQGEKRGNSGLFILGHPEIQILDSFRNRTPADAQAGALYGQYPPLVNAARPPGEWQSYDVVYEAPRLDSAKKVVRSARYTVFHNGVLIHHAVEVPGNVVECPLGLQENGSVVRFRNIWVRRLKGYDGTDLLP